MKNFYAREDENTSWHGLIRGDDCIVVAEIAKPFSVSDQLKCFENFEVLI